MYRLRRFKRRGDSFVVEEVVGDLLQAFDAAAAFFHQNKRLAFLRKGLGIVGMDDDRNGGRAFPEGFQHMDVDGVREVRVQNDEIHGLMVESPLEQGPGAFGQPDPEAFPAHLALQEAAHMRVAVGDHDGENSLHADVQSNSCTNSPADPVGVISS